MQTFYFTLTSSLRWQFETLPQVSELFCPPAPVPFVLRCPVITGTLLKVWGSCHMCSSPTTIKADFKIKSACSAMLLPSPLSPPTFLLLPLLSISPASHTDEQMLPRDRFHINDGWLLTPNEPPLSDQRRIPLGAELICPWRGAEAGFGKPSLQLAWPEIKWMNWGEVRTYPLEQRRNTTVSGHAMRGRPSKPADRKRKGSNLVIPLVHSFLLSNIYPTRGAVSQCVTLSNMTQH